MTETETTPTPTMGDSNEAAQIGQRAQQLIEEIDNFLKTTSSRHNIPTTEIQNHLLDIRRLAVPDNTVPEQN
tara:strand:- start:53 stop:268 length:216 start_codon:yes stop_codon:yes gene_type:complete